jgi:uncharacterized protein YndB with AHSA1/START domain
MAEMHHEIQIEASPQKVYDAITAQEGLRSWWTADSVAKPSVGTIAEFGFDKRTILFRMRVEELKPGKRVVWACLGDPDEWKGTRLTWDISQRGKITTLHFTHSDWRSATSFFATCNSTWGELMYRLKAYAEGKSPGPHWRE